MTASPWQVLRNALIVKDNALRVSIADDEYRDSFGRLRISSPHSIFNSVQTISKETDKWTETTASGGTSTLNTNKACVEMAVTSASGSKVIRQTKRSMYYLPGVARSIHQSFVFAPAKTGLRQRIGAFHTNDGVFLELTGSTLNIVLRSNVTGTPTDTPVAQSSWNKDKLDGTGASGTALAAIDYKELY